MKRIGFLLLLPVLLFATLSSFEAKIYTGLLDSLFARKPVRVWIDCEQKRPFFDKLKRVKVVDDPKRADVLILFSKGIKGSDKPVIVGRYGLMGRCGGNCVAAFYWKKGRPHLILVGPNLRRFGIKIPPSYRPYVIEEP